MRYLSIYRPTSGEEGSMPAPEHMAAMGRLVEEMTRSGHLLSTEPVAPRDAGCLISRSGGHVTVGEDVAYKAQSAFVVMQRVVRDRGPHPVPVAMPQRHDEAAGRRVPDAGEGFGDLAVGFGMAAR